MLKSTKLLIQTAVLFLINVVIIMMFTSVPTTHAVVYKSGSSGQTVTDIQTKLKQWGYYSGSIDGMYGAQTVEAVKYFQRKNGLNADGIAGNSTLSAMGIDTAQNSDAGRENDLYLLSRIISAEARGEEYAGQVAVGAVIMNRVRHPSFPDSLSGVIYQPGAFTALVDGQFNVAISASARNAAIDAMNGWDPTGGAIYYYNPAKTTNKWIYSRPVVKRIGSHVFAK